MGKIAFIGLGIMGKPMALNLIKAGHEVKIFTRNKNVLQEVAAQGGIATSSIGEAVENSDFIITMLQDSPEVEEVSLGENGIYKFAKPGAIHIDYSNISPSSARKIAEAAKEKGLHNLDAPVSGGEIGAIEGTLSIMVGGDKEIFDKAFVVLEAVGKTIVLFGPSGSGQTVKAANHLIVAGTIQLVVVEVILEKITNISMGASIDAVKEFEELATSPEEAPTEFKTLAVQ